MRTVILLPALLTASLAASAQTAERDPLRPPAEARPAAAPASAAASAPETATADWRPRTLIASAGRRWMVQDGRRYGIGDAFGSARIDRIDDDAVWLREAGKLTRVPLFGTVAKKPPGSTPTTQPPAVRKERQP